MTALERGRELYSGHAWLDAHAALAEADRSQPLAPQDLELLARSAYMLGLDDEYSGALERAHAAYVEAGDLPAAARCTFWIGHSAMFRGDAARAAGWFARGDRLLERHGEACVEAGYLKIPVWLQAMGSGDYEAAYATTLAADEIGETFADPDLTWLARHEQGRALLGLARRSEAMRLVDEALVVAAGGELSPIVTGIVYCNTISFCHDAYELRHVLAWTDALTEWCDRQPQMVAHNGLCLVHRAEGMALKARLDPALDEARRAVERFSLGVLNQMAAGKAFYCQGEVHRLQGDHDEAEHAYREASQRGVEPQPGLALLRLAQGDIAAAAAMIRRVVGETTAPVSRAGLLPAYVEVMLAAGEVDHARAACQELEQLASGANEVLTAMASQSRGAMTLVAGDPSGALVLLRQALATWVDLGARYESSRVRELIALACRALGDEGTAQLELEAARAVFEEAGAALDKARVEALLTPATPAGAHGLTPRELEVLRLISAGRTNREIAEALVISEHTVARHVQNILTKLGVSSRTAASAFAFGHDLV